MSSSPDKHDTPRTDAHLAHLNLPGGRKIGIPDQTVELLRELERLAKRWQQIADQRAIEVADLRCAKSAELPTVTDEWVRGVMKAERCDELEARMQIAHVLEAMPRSTPSHEQRRPQWQPIETAPRDGTDVLLAVIGKYGYGEIDVGSWGFIERSDWDGSDVIGWSSNYGRIDEPTHWMPLPDSPESTVRKP